MFTSPRAEDIAMPANRAGHNFGLVCSDYAPHIQFLIVTPVCGGSPVVQCFMFTPVCGVSPVGQWL